MRKLLKRLLKLLKRLLKLLKRLLKLLYKFETLLKLLKRLEKTRLRDTGTFHDMTRSEPADRRTTTRDRAIFEKKEIKTWGGTGRCP